MNRLLSKKGKLILVAAIIALGFFLRAYHFSDWLHFELDQSRDAKVIDLAVKEGPGQLPLLGPKAAGSFLRLGPVFYYFKYLSALMFGDTPSGMAMIIMIFGILAIPAFYILVRRYFNKWISIALLLIFSTSLFLIMYSRFSWNPNALPLFTILTFYSLLRAVDKEEKRKGTWLLLGSFCLAVATQLHFLAFVSVPVIALAFIIIKRPKIKWAYWAGAIGIILLMNFPVILNEIKTGGDNFKEFKAVVTGKSDGDKKKSLFEKIARNYEEHSANYFLILSSQNSEFPKITQKPSLDIKCDEKCHKGLPLGVAGLIIITAGLLFLLRSIIFEKDHKKKDFLIISGLWFLVSFGLFIPLAFDISPRFWLLVSALPFIFLGFTFELLKKITPKKFSLVLITIIILGLASSNLYQTYKRFNELGNASSQAVKVSADRILRENQRVTLEQQYLIIDYIESFYKKNSYPVYLNSDPYYRRSFLYHMDKRNIPRDDFRNATISGKVYKNGNYFLVYPTNSDLDEEINKYSKVYAVGEEKQFGTLTVIPLIPKAEAINAIQQEFEPGDNVIKKPGVPKRYTWEEIFNSAEEEENGE